MLAVVAVVSLPSVMMSALVPTTQPTVDIWRLSLSGETDHLPRLASCLSDEERQRASRFRTPAQRIDYVESHVGLRDILGQYLQLPADDVVVTRSCPRCGSASHGRIAIGNPQTQGLLSISLSRRRGLALVAVGQWVGPIGVDCERTDATRDWRDLAPAYSRFEQQRLERMSANEVQRFALQLWSSKEAATKAAGVGLAIDPRLVTADLSSSGDGWVELSGSGCGETSAWRVRMLVLDESFVGAVATRSEPRIRYQSWALSDRHVKG